jgi:hypothetical protein
LLSDLGEGKDITRSATSRESQPSSSNSTATIFSLEEYIAPDIANHSRSSKADDIFAWAQLGVEIIRKNYELLRSKDGDVIYPAGLMKVLEGCLDPNPAGRFTAASLVVVMDEVIDGPSGLSASAYGEETEWYDGSYELPQVRKKLATTYELGPHWLTLASGKMTADSDS